MTNPLSKDVLELSEVCNRTQYQVTNLIQACYVLLVFDQHTHHIVYVSTNVADIFGLAPNDIIGQSFLDLLSRPSATSLGEMLEEELKNNSSSRIHKHITIKATQLKRGALVYKSGPYFCAELPLTSAPDISADYIDLHLRVAEDIVNFQGRSNELANKVCELISRIIGFDRIWYCEFDEYGNGYVSGEYNNGTLHTLINHRFPATDIPQNIRPVYVLNKFRTIVDANEPPVFLVGKNGTEAELLDLTYSLARRPGQTHIDYLNNMEVSSSTSFSVVTNGQLTAIFGAHSKTPLYRSYQQLASCKALVDHYFPKFQILSDAERMHGFITAKNKVFVCIDALESCHFNLTHFVKKQYHQIQTLFQSDGFMCIHRGQVSGADHLSESERLLLASFIRAQIKDQMIYKTHSLLELDEAFVSLKDRVSGLLAVRIEDREGYDNSILFVWMRKEWIHLDQWAGNPSQAVIQDTSGGVGPRKSFETWANQIHGNAIPWAPFELDLANYFKDVFASKKLINQEMIASNYSKNLDVALKEALAEKHFTQAIIDAIPEPIFVKGQNHLLIGGNKSFWTMLGVKAERYIDRSDQGLFPPEQQAMFWNKEDAVIQSGKVNTNEELIKYHDGRLVTALTTRSPLDIPDGSKGVVGVIHDITALKVYEKELKKHRDDLQALVDEQTKDIRAQKEKAEQATKAKSEFFANMSHELRTPMHAVLSYAHMGLKPINKDAPEKLDKYFTNIEVAGKRLLELLDNLLDIAKIDSGKMKYHFISADFKEVIEYSQTELDSLIKKKNLNFEIHLKVSDTLAIFDKLRMIQVLVNLFSNAIRFSPKNGRIEIILSETNLHDGRYAFCCSVANEGDTIPEEELEVIFDQFVQSSKIKKGAGGTGLGLAISREIIEAHGGKIWAKNDEGKRIIFSFLIPKEQGTH